MRVNIGDIVRFTENMRDIVPNVVGKLGIVVAMYMLEEGIHVDIQLIGKELYQTVLIEDIKEIIV